MTAPGSDSHTEWEALLRSLCGGLADPLGVWRLLERGAAALADDDTAEAHPQDRLRSALSAQAADPGYWAALLRGYSAALDTLLRNLPPEATSQAPPLGPFQRQQALLRSLQPRLRAYQRALAGHLEQVARLLDRCQHAFGAGLAEAPAESEALAARWLEVAEREYEAWLAEEEVQVAMAALTNRGAELAAALRELADETLELFGLPSSRALDDLAAELQRQRRRQREGQAALRAEIAALWQALERDTR